MGVASCFIEGSVIRKLHRLPPKDPPRTNIRERDRARVPDDVKARWLAEYPWLARFMNTTRKRPKPRDNRRRVKERGVRPPPVGESDADAETEDDDKGDDEPKDDNDDDAGDPDIRAVLLAKREELKWTDEAQFFFYTTVRAWVDCVTGYPRGSAGKVVQRLQLPGAVRQHFLRPRG